MGFIEGGEGGGAGATRGEIIWQLKIKTPQNPVVLPEPERVGEIVVSAWQTLGGSELPLVGSTCEKDARILACMR